MARRPIPLPPIDGIKDPDVRAALRAITDYFGSREFLTAEDFGLSSRPGGGGGTPVPGGGGSPPGSVWTRPPLPGEVGRIISYLENSIRASALFRRLGERIDLIDKPTTGIVFRLGKAEGTISSQGTALKGVEVAIAEEIQARIDGQNAILIETRWQWSQVNQFVAMIQQQTATIANTYQSEASQRLVLQATVGQIYDDINDPRSGIKAALEQEALVRANADGQLYGRWTVRIDLNGYVSGFGIDAIGNRNGSDSMGLWRVDTFAIAGTTGVALPGSPPKPIQYPGETNAAFAVRLEEWTTAVAAIQRAYIQAEASRVDDDNPPGLVAVPFIVKTNTWLDAGGVPQPPGVYMRRAMIQKLVVDEAYIRAAAVTTLKVGEDAITVPRRDMLQYGPACSAAGGSGGTDKLVYPYGDYPLDFRTLDSAGHWIGVEPSGIAYLATFYFDQLTGGGCLAEMTCLENGVSLGTLKFAVANNTSTAVALMWFGPHAVNRTFFVTGPVGINFSVRVVHENGVNHGVNPAVYQVSQWRLLIMGTKR